LARKRQQRPRTGAVADAATCRYIV